MQVINKRIIVIFICLSIFIFGLFKLFNKEKVVLDDVVLDINNSKDSLAIYIEEYDEEGNASYVESNDNKFPLDKYVYNKELSGCLDSNSNEVENALNYNYVDKELNLRVNKPVTCYVYYDYKGDGTEKVPYKIRSIEDLLDLSKAVNLGTTYANTYFELTRDLDFRDINSYNDSERTDYGNLNGVANDGDTLKQELTTGTGWIPIGNSSANSFQGIFDGNNKEIYNFYLNNSDSSITNSGLFGIILNSAKIKNLTLNGEITSNASNVGGIVASGWGIDAVIDNCHNKATITGTKVSTGNVGGLVGGSGGFTIKNSSNKGKIIGNSKYIGGLIGYHNSQLTIENSYNKGMIETMSAIVVGGLLGYSDSTSLESPTIIKNSYNEGDIIINGSDRIIYIGGLIGYHNSLLTIENSYNKGNIETNIASSMGTTPLGGLIGYDGGKVIITKSYNEGNITGGNRVGGLVGFGNTKEAVIIIDKSYNAGDLVPSENSNWTGGGIHVGGIISYAWAGTQLYLFNSYNMGNIKGSSTKQLGDSSGIIDGVSSNNDSKSLVSIVNSYNKGNIKISSHGRGIIWFPDGICKINNIYNIGDFNDVTEKYGIGYFNSGQDYSVKKAYYKNNDNILGSNITSNEIISKDLNEMQSEAFVTELNNNIENITLTDYIDNTLLEEFKNTTGYELTLSKWTIKDGHPVLVDLEGM